MFSVIYLGHLLPGFRKHQVAMGLKQYFQLTDQQADKFLLGRRVLKRQVGVDDAQKIHKLCQSIGLSTRIVSEDKDEQQAESNGSILEGPISIEAQDTTQASLHDDEWLEKTERVGINNHVKRSSDGRKTPYHSQLPKNIEHKKVSFKYGIALLLVSFVALITPIFYLAFVALVLCILLFFTPGTYGFGWLSSWEFIYTLPFVLLTLILLSLIRPFIKKNHTRSDVTLNRSKHKDFYHLVDNLCAALDVSPPQKIIVHALNNASIQPLGGIVGILRRRYVLMIGMPFFAAFEQKNLVGVLSHEFGHCTQRVAMLANYSVNTVNSWLARNAYDDDPIDLYLLKWSKDSRLILFTPFFYIVAKMLSGTRRILSGLLSFNVMLTTFMSRHMEFDADYYESIMVGSHHFHDTSIMLRKLAIAQQFISEINEDVWKDGRLLENLPEAYAYYAQFLPKESVDQIKAEMDQESTCVWDTHPADNERIALVEKQQHKGYFSCNEPSCFLISNYDSLCRQVTLAHYKTLGYLDAELRMMRNENILEISLEKGKSAKAIRDYMGGKFSGRILMFTLPFDKNGSGQMSLNQCVKYIRSHLIDYHKHIETYHSRMRKISDILVARCKDENGIHVSLDSIVADHEGLNIDQLITLYKQKMRAEEHAVNEIEQVIFRRIIIALSSLDGDVAKEAKNLLKWILDAQKMSNAYENLKKYSYVLTFLLSPKEEAWPKMEETQDEFKMYCIEEMNRFIRLSSVMPNLEEKSLTKRSLMSCLNSWGIRTIEDAVSLTPHYVQEKSETILQAFDYQYYRVFSDLCVLCLDREKKLGIKPLRLVDLTLDE